jgi:hypothetical protein
VTTSRAKLRKAEVRRATKFANTRAGEVAEAVTNLDGQQAQTITKEDDMLIHESLTLNEHHK